MMKFLYIFSVLFITTMVFANGPETTTDYVKIYDPSIGESQQWYINDHCLIYGNDGKWHLYGITDPEPMSPGDEDELAHASCETLHGVWKKEPYALTVRPDLKETYLWAPHVNEHEGTYYMYYCAGGWPSDQHQISLATSKDLYNWKRYEKNPVILDGYDARDAFVLKDGDHWIMYYTATSTPTGGNHTVTSTNLLDWSNPVTVYIDKSTGTWGGPTESPNVIRRGDYYYLFIGPRDMQYRHTCVYKSKNPLKWTDDDYVARINSHAAEVIRDIDGTWYASHCSWGQGGVYLAKLDWNDGLDAKSTSYDPPVKVAPEKVQSATYRIPMKEYRSKMLAGWVGQMVAVTWGFPVEFKYLGKMVPEYDVPAWKPEMINGAFGQDDLYVEMTFLRSMQKYGLNVTGRQAGFDFANSKYPLWHANKAARDNLRKGIATPDSGHPDFNKHADDIDFQIEADFAGLLSPAMPASAVRMADKFASIMNYGDGKYGGLFVAAMYSYAFVENNIETVVNKALKVIPEQSQYYEAISDTIKWYKQYPNDWEKTWNLINDKYQNNPDYRKTSCNKGDFNIDAKINGAFIVMGLLYGKGNVEDTIVISMRGGQDADCNPSNAAGILFTMLGMDRIHHKYRQYDENTNFQYTKYDMISLVDVCEVLAKRNVLMAGGKIEVDKFGNEILVINSDPAKPVKFEDTLNPAPPVKSTYTHWELKQLTSVKSADPVVIPEKITFGEFVTVKDAKLYDDNGQLWFVSFNIPCLHYNEDGLAFDEKNPWSFPTDFEISDALEAVSQMGGKVVRIYALSVVSKGEESRPYETPKHVLGAGKFNEEAFECLDRVIAIADQKQIRLIIPLVDNWKWWGGIADYTAFSGKDKDAFWADPTVIADFKKTIDYVLNRTNTITGRKYKNEKAILAWETGNELQSPDDWTLGIAKYIKTVDENHLLVDGFYTEVVKQSSIDNPYIDFVTSHHYSLDYKHTLKQIEKSIKVAKGIKPYFIGEFGFLPTSEISEIADMIIDHDVSGALLWTLRKRRDTGGFYSHSEPLGHDKYKAYHWPGFASGDYYDERNILYMMAQKAAQINGVQVPKLPVPKAPTLFKTDSVSAISFQGSAGAQGYKIERTENLLNNKWTVLTETFSDASVQYYPLFNDTAARPGRSYYYRVYAKNSTGQSEASSIIGPIKVSHRTLVDNCGDFNKLSLGHDGVIIDASNARSFKEDMTRFAIDSGAITYKLPSDVVGVKVYSFIKEKDGSVTIEVSADNRKYKKNKSDIKDFSSGSGDYGYWRPVVYEAEISASGNTFVRISTSANVQIGRIEISYDRSTDATRLSAHKAQMDDTFMKGSSWGWTGWRGQYLGPGPVESMQKLADTGANWLAISFAAEMVKFNEPKILYSKENDRVITDDELRRSIMLARKNGLKVVLKPVVNVRDNTWRAWIKFNVGGGEVADLYKEPEKRDMVRWSQWWGNYREFLLYYADIAEETGCDMLCLGCEMISTEGFVDEWRSLIDEVRDHYSGPITYNTNHGNHNGVKWWDAVDLISMSAYFPIGSDEMDGGCDYGKKSGSTLDAMLRRWKPIKKWLAEIAHQFDRKILFIETGVCSAKGFSAAPWSHHGQGIEYDGDEQARFYEGIYRTFWNEDWWAGVTWWEWYPTLYPEEEAGSHVDFCPYGKPAEGLTRKWYKKKR